jgi:hypothetical protein
MLHPPLPAHHRPCQPKGIAPEDGAHRRGPLSAGGEQVVSVLMAFKVALELVSSGGDGVVSFGRVGDQTRKLVGRFAA